MCEKRVVKFKLISSLTFFLVLISFLSTSKADATGKLAGRIVDTKTGEPLPGANIMIDGTILGGAADMDGDYFILNVPPGSYSITVSMIGYGSQKKTGVRVNIDKTTRLDFELHSEAFETEAIIVEAKNLVIQPDIASTLNILSSKDIASAPVAQFKELLDKQVGLRDSDMRGIIIRGEREYALSMKIEGLETRDNVDSQVETRLNPDAVQEVNILTGGINAEYGNATSGLINVVLKEGGDKYSGTADVRMSIPSQKHFGSSLREYYDQAFDNPEHWETQANSIDTSRMSSKEKQIYSQFIGKPDLLRELYLWRMRDEESEYGNKSDYIVRGTVGGPVPLVNNTKFFFSGIYEKTYYLFNQAQPFYDNMNLTGKITTQLSPKIKISLTGRYAEVSGINRYDRKESVMSLGVDRQDDPNQTRENRYVFENVESIAWVAATEQAHLSPWPYVDRMSISERFKNQWSIKLTHTLNSKTFYDLSVMFSNYRIYGSPAALRDTNQTVTLKDKFGNIATMTGEYALAPNGYWPVELRDPLGMAAANILGGTHGNYEVSKDKSFIIRANMVSQLDKVNQFNAGLEYYYVDLDKKERREGSDGKRYWWDWHVYPSIFSAWIQDKLEFEGMIVNAGIRADARIPHRSWININNFPFDYHWSYDFREGYLGNDSISTGPYYKPPTKWILSPRLSVAHPIGSEAKIYFNYTHQNQDPPVEYQYKIQRRSDKPDGDIFGDPELPDIRTIQYEVGYEQNIADIFFAALSGFYRDVSNKIALVDFYGQIDTISTGQRYRTRYQKYAGDIYSSAVGLEIRLEKRVGRYWTGWFNYNYELYNSGIKGYSRIYQDPTNDPRARNTDINNNTNVKPTPIPKLNIGLNLHTPPRWGPSVGSFYVLSSLNLNLLFWWKSQPTFTYNPDDLRPPYDPINNKRWKPHHAINLNFSKRFEITPLVTPVFYVYISNLFNSKNMFRGAFTDSQLEDYVKLLEDQGGEPGEREDLARQVLINSPSTQGPGTTPYDLYLNPRQIFVGLRLEFN
jgi:hypothetical protein